MSDQPCQATPSALLEQQIMDSNIPKNEREHWAANEIHRLRDILGGGCPMHPRVSLLDRIQAIRDAAEQNGQHDLAQWLTRHADEGCDAVIAWAMREGELPLLRIPTSMDAVKWAEFWLAHVTYNPSIATDEGTMIGWFANVAMAGYDEARRRYESTPPFDPPAPDASDHICQSGPNFSECPICAGQSKSPTSAPAASTDAVREAIAALHRHMDCDDAQCRFCLPPRACMMIRMFEPVVAALANLRQETYAIRTANNNKIADAEKRAKEAEVQRDTSSANYRNLYYAKVIRPVEAEVAALTRKLATVHADIDALISRIYNGDLVPQLIIIELQSILAAIDAPAAEGGFGDHPCCAEVRGYSAPGDSHPFAPPAPCQFSYCRLAATNEGYCEAHNPPPEPANAQGSEHSHPPYRCGVWCGYFDDDKIAQQQRILAAESQIVERDAQIAALEQWRNNVSGVLKRSPLFEAGEWGGDKDGWGYHFELVKHLIGNDETLRAQIADTESKLRKEWWLNHRCPISALYGDDGEMACNASCCMKDFKRAPIGELSAHVCQRRLAKATADMTLLEEARAQIAEMRKELATERDVIESMRARAYRVRGEVNLTLFEIEQIALADKKRIAELGLEANDGE